MKQHPLLQIVLVVAAMVAAMFLASCGETAAPPTQAPATGATAAPTVVALATMAPTTMPAQSDLTPTPVPAPESPAAPSKFPPAIALEPLASVPDPITYLTHAGDGSGRLFLVEKAGRVSIIDAGRVQASPFLDITDVVGSGGSEQGLLSIAFAPDYATSGRFYVNYTDRNGDTVLARYHLSDDPARADAGSGEILLTIDQPAANHNGGQLQFGPDGYLYMGTGDGGRANDPWNNAENLGVLLGKLLRLDVSGSGPYAIPADNPFVNDDEARPEIWAYGLRNPWRFSFDRATGNLFIADVGQNAWEEIDVQPAGSAGGEHYGWDTMEASHCFEPASGCNTNGKVLPIAEYGHGEGCSVTGGYVYRGQAFPQLTGSYFFADFCTGQIWAMRSDEQSDWQVAPVFDSDLNIASFGEDEAGELYVLDLDGSIFRVVATP